VRKEGKEDDYRGDREKDEMEGRVGWMKRIVEIRHLGITQPGRFTID
jgi:hypothetical protein